jgi:hypothetical protein
MGKFTSRRSPAGMGSSYESEAIGENRAVEIGERMYRIVAVEPLEKYRVRIRFLDGTEGEVDLSSLVGKGVFALWNDSEEFAKVFVDPESHTLAWPGGIDLCPETLYQDIVTQKPAVKKIG